ncbi:MAG: hypothetical protein M9945_11695 [Aquamicrobium sp.]|uniref:hypothetical protein n=1 Tax=Aquamicrobium sp. TaxID=1872579 RepID=UPI00349E9055|nr:hypothetical protein [Aquamicrobium sp.]
MMPRAPHIVFAAAGLVCAALGLAGCTSSQVLEPTALVGTPPAPASPTAFPLATPAAPGTTPGQVAAIATDARVQFAPVVGAPANAATPLAGRLSARAGAHGIALVGTGDSSATLVMKGYFSAISDSGQTTVIYVWDVTDPAGTRVHRIQGQAKAPSSGADGWDDVRPATMESIADETIDRLATWLSGRQG